MLTLTKDAATAIQGLCAQADVPDAGLRIFATPVDETQATLEMALTPAPGPGDQVVEDKGATIYLEQNAAAYLEDKILDASMEGEGVRFSVDEQEGTPGA